LGESSPRGSSAVIALHLPFATRRAVGVPRACRA
jgi:hypothetical protein